MYLKRDSILLGFDQLGLAYSAPLSIIANTISDFNMSEQEVSRLYNNLVGYKILERTYDKTREWPTIFWDEYYEDGNAVTLNWELVSNNLATVYVKQLQIEGDSVISAEESALIPRRVN